MLNEMLSEPTNLPSEFISELFDIINALRSICEEAPNAYRGEYSELNWDLPTNVSSFLAFVAQQEYPVNPTSSFICALTYPDGLEVSLRGREYRDEDGLTHYIIYFLNIRCLYTLFLPLPRY